VIFATTLRPHGRVRFLLFYLLTGVAGITHWSRTSTPPFRPLGLGPSPLLAPISSSPRVSHRVMVPSSSSPLLRAPGRHVPPLLFLSQVLSGRSPPDGVDVAIAFWRTSRFVAGRVPSAVHLRSHSPARFWRDEYASRAPGGTGRSEPFSAGGVRHGRRSARLVFFILRRSSRRSSRSFPGLAQRLLRCWSAKKDARHPARAPARDDNFLASRSCGTSHRTTPSVMRRVELTTPRADRPHPSHAGRLVLAATQIAAPSATTRPR